MPSVYGVILAGGKGTRVGGDQPKQLQLLNDRPLVAWAVDAFQSANAVDRILIVSPKAYFNDIWMIANEYGYYKVLDVVEGGATRQESSYNALTSRNFNDDDILLLHDAARPFVSSEIIIRSVDAAVQYGAAGVYVPAVDTIAEIEGESVTLILNRNRLYYTQTPQAFVYTIIRHAHEKALLDGIKGATDDVSLVVSAGHTIHMVEGDYSNIKITSAHDFNLAECILNSKHLY